MCYLNLFTALFSFYFILLVVGTIYRKQLTYKGLFYIFTIFLGIFLFFLLIHIEGVLIFGNFIEFKLMITNITWLNLELSLSFKLDSLAYFFTLLVTVIGFSTNIYILNYFKYEANEDIFSILIHWFIFSMLTLVLANNLFTLFLGWESIGLTSFFLINFWYNRRGTVKSSFKAFVFNKASDVFLFIFIVSLAYINGTSNITLINLKFLVNLTSYNMLLQLSIYSLIMCAMFKSAQLFTHLWLPDSMEAPVPASALIHSATLVSAGLYLLMRFSILINICQVHNLIIVIGGLTALYGGIVSASQTDMKKLLAYSTISHCGFLFLSVGLDYYISTIIYLFLHGLFKAMTFFCAGSFIRVYGTQDTRGMGCGHRLMPIDTIFLIICAVNLGGLPFSFGYLYKATVIVAILNTNIASLCFGLVFFALLTGLIYTYRLIFYSIFDISKEHVLPTLLELQIKKNKLVNNFSLTSVVQIISICIMYLFTVYIYLLFVNIFLLNDLIFNQLICQISCDSLSTNYTNLLYSIYYEIFYNSYYLCGFIIFLITWRYNYTCHNKHIMVLTISYIFFISLFVFIYMWGHILTEASTQQNFNFGFSTYKSEVLIHLSQWQYWWWFWFSIWWSLYYFIILKLITKRTFNFQPVINTSIRGHGKWGDFLVALIPLSWCCNILINSNFILRMIEWQNESSLFTIRVQGKQWYWVYKFDANTSQSINSTPKNIGHNRWVIFLKNESYHADTYYQAVHLAAQLEFQDSYTSLSEKNEINKKSLNANNLTTDKLFLTNSWLCVIKPTNDVPFNYTTSTINPNLLTNSSCYDYIDKLHSNHAVELSKYKNTSVDTILLPLISQYNYSIQNPLYVNWLGSYNNFNSYYDFLKLDETSDSTGNLRSFSATIPFRLIKGILNQHTTHILQSTNNIENFEKLLFLNCKFINSGELMREKELIPETLWGFRQKKYKRIKKFNFKPQAIYDNVTFKVIGFNSVNLTNSIDIAGVDLSYNILKKEKKLVFSNLYNYYLSIKVNRNKSELVPITLARRLLRTKRTLVLPAHVNLTVITNSYDVVHSWFIPGLGLKLDCVPGRSTHHTFYIDNIGFYYGQCAEICGRYHHHMPIRLCALPFEQFVVWWQSKGLPRLNRLTMVDKNKFFNNNFSNNVTFKKLIYQNT